MQGHEFAAHFHQNLTQGKRRARFKQCKGQWPGRTPEWTDLDSSDKSPIKLKTRLNLTATMLGHGPCGVLLQGDSCSNDSHPSGSFPNFQFACVHTHHVPFKTLLAEHQIASFNTYS